MAEPVGYIRSLTPLRGIAALWVVFFHSNAMLGILGYPGLLSSRRAGILDKGYLWVDFFFVLSGFIITHVYGRNFAQRVSRPAVRNYFNARFGRLIPLHYFTLAILLIQYPLLRHLTPSAAVLTDLCDWNAVPAHLIMGHAMGMTHTLTWNAPSWSIAAEWWTYLVAIPLFPLAARGGVLRAWLTIAAGYGALYLLFAWRPRHTLDLAFDYGFFRCLFEFVVGIGVYQLFVNRHGADLLRRDLAMVVAIAGILTCMISRAPDPLIIPFFALLILCAAYNQGSARRVLNTKPLSFLGEISYSVYMVQGVYLTLLIVFLDSQRPVLERLHPGWGWGLSLVFVSLVLVTAVLTFRGVEIPARAWLKGRTARSVTTHRAV
jgi:peptidoglycan/LPS O-acetylase OafA/YrhL